MNRNRLGIRFLVTATLLFFFAVSTPTQATPTQSTISATTPLYRIPCKVTKSGNWGVVRTRKKLNDQQLINDINTRGRRAHQSGPGAIDLNSNPRNLGPRTYGICNNLTVLSAKAGRVIYNQFSRTSGWTVIISHQNGQRSLYAHLARRSPLQINKSYPEGTVVGTMGQTGSNAHGVHLHFEVQVNNRRTSNWVFSYPF